MKLLTFGFLLTFTFTLFGQISILEENFDTESLPEGWKVINNDSHQPDESVQEYTEAWIIKEDPLNAGNGTVSSTSYFTPVNRADRWLITPQFTLGSIGNYVSWNGMSHDPSFPDSYKVLISKTGNAIEDFQDTIIVINYERPEWTARTESLEGYENTPVYLAFVNTTYDGFKLYLDSIYIREQDPLALEKEEIAITIFPNPVQDFLVLKTKNSVIEQVTIYSALGSEVETKKVSQLDSEFKLNISALQSGIYFISIQTNQGTVLKKIVK